MGATAFDELRWAEKAQKPVFRHEAALGLLRGNERSILDIGCGDGLFLSMARKKYPHLACTGAEISHSALERAKKNVPDAAFVSLRGTDEPLPFPDDAFDVVVALDVLEHVFMPERVVKEMRRVARHGVLIGVPNFSSLPARLQALRGAVPENNRPSKGHVYWFNYRVLSKHLAQAHLRLSALRTNVFWGRIPLMGALARIFPNLFALSFVAYAEK